MRSPGPGSASGGPGPRPRPWPKKSTGSGNGPGIRAVWAASCQGLRKGLNIGSNFVAHPAVGPQSLLLGFCPQGQFRRVIKAMMDFAGAARKDGAMLVSMATDCDDHVEGLSSQ